VGLFGALDDVSSHTGCYVGSIGALDGEVSHTWASLRRCGASGRASSCLGGLWDPAVVHEMPGYRIDAHYWTDALTYELAATDPAGGGPCLAIEVPDETPAGDHYLAMGPQHAVVHASDGSVPWPALYWFLGRIMSIGDMSGLRGPARPMPAREVWTHDGRWFTVVPYALIDGAHRIEVVPGESLTAYGSCRIPWPVFRRFLEAVERDGGGFGTHSSP
jgi:hypothetical protein